MGTSGPEKLQLFEYLVILLYITQKKDDVKKPPVPAPALPGCCAEPSTHDGPGAGVTRVLC